MPRSMIRRLTGVFPRQWRVAPTAALASCLVAPVFTPEARFESAAYAQTPDEPILASVDEPDFLGNALRMEPAAAWLGEIRAGEQDSWTFLIHNEGDEPIQFTRFQSTCPCVSGEIELRVIDPGDAAEMTVKWDETGGVNGRQVRNVWLHHDRGREPFRLPVGVQIVGGEERQPVDRDAPEVRALPEIEAPLEVDFGIMRPDEERVKEVKLTNNGAKPVRFTTVRTTCGCATGEILEGAEQIAPGESATLRLTFTAKGNVGPQNQTITVFIAGSPIRVQMGITAQVSHPLNADPFFINTLAGKNGEIALTSIEGGPFRVLSMNGAPVAGAGAPRLEHTVGWSLESGAPEFDEPTLAQFFLIETDHAIMPLLALRIVDLGILTKAQQNAPGWSPAPDHIVLGRMQPAKSFQHVIKLAKLRVDTKITVQPIDSSITVDLMDAKFGGGSAEITLLITPTENLKTDQGSGIVRTGVRIHTAEPEGSYVIPVYGVSPQEL